jgi:lysine 2,3-aminomutase
MIVILKAANTCPQICVYCQRNWEIEGPGEERAIPDTKTLRRAIDWIADHEAIVEVLVTGGDPFIVPDDRIYWVLDQLSAIGHVERIRIGTRTPVTLPQRMTPQLVDLVGAYHEPGRREMVLVTHVEHCYEATPEMVTAVQRVRRFGIPVYNQMVYTIENSRRFEAAATRRMLRLVGIEPYYTFNMKGKEEMRGYRVPIARILQEQKEEARLMPGLMRTDTVVYNVPRLGKNPITSGQHHQLIGVLPNGRRVYEFHPWEKKLSLVDTYVGTDVSIKGYLDELERRGEAVADYGSIWYYY